MFTKPSDVLDRRLILRDGVPIPQLLVSWFGASIEEALWVDEIDFTLTYPDFRYEGRSERKEPHSASPTEESRTDDEAEVKKWPTEIKHWKDDAEGSDVGSVSKGEESQTNEAAEVSKWTAEKENREDDEERFGSTAWRVAAETNSQGADRVSHNSAPHPFIEPLESSVKLTSVGLEDKAFPQGVGIDKAHSSYGPTAVNKPVRLKSASAWAADFEFVLTRKELVSDITLTDADIGRAGIASFAGSIFSRLSMGPACDLVGPRAASAAFSLLTAPAVLAVSFISTARSLIIIRFLIGFSLANFVACQFWMSSMFAGDVVGKANGVSAGWAAVGTGVTQLVMPLIYSFLVNFVNLTSSTAWRVAFAVPVVFQITTALAILAYGQDLPDGKYRRTRKPSQKKSDESALAILLRGFKNYRGWILGLTYGFCFGVELTTDNIIAQYFYQRFDLDMAAAGAIAASFGFANIVTRPAGGVISDVVGRRYGMRGRVWSLWAAQTTAGFVCYSLGRVNSLWGSVLVMCCFSLFVQAASGLTFGVVPFVSRRSLGVISGVTGCGGTIGAVVTQMSTQTSISIMGIMMVFCTLPLTLLYFPGSGGMFCGPSPQYCSSLLEEGDMRLLR
ncbi:hypothetical protein OROGR_018352 [Orobanche gracilis]